MHVRWRCTGAGCRSTRSTRSTCTTLWSRRAHDVRHSGTTEWELPLQKPGRDQCKLLFCMFRQHSKNSAPRAYKFWVPNCNGADARRPEWRFWLTERVAAVLRPRCADTGRPP